MNQGMSESARLILRETNVMVSLPEICIKLREVLDDAEHNRNDIAEVMRYDPALTARLLRIVNSAYYGLPYQVNSISQALGILGEAELNNLVLVTSIMKMSNAMESRLNITQFWKCSVHAAVLARNLCAPELAGTREEYFLSGLLLNIGKLLLYTKAPALQLEVFAEMQAKGLSESEAEQQLTGTDHTYVGALLAKSWNFSDSLIKHIASHHQAHEEGEKDSSFTVMNLTAYFSDCYENSISASSRNMKKEIELCPFDYSILQLDEEALSTILEASLIDHQEVYEVFCSDMH